MTLLKNAKNGQNAHHSIESMLLSQSPTVKEYKEKKNFVFRFNFGPTMTLNSKKM